MINKEKIEYLQLNYFQSDEPVPYELKCGTTLYLYPITVKDYPLYSYAQEIMNIDKNSFNDIEIIQMNYLEFLCNILLLQDEQNDNTQIQMQVANYFKLTTHKDSVYIDMDKNNRLVVCLVENNVTTDIITAKELDDIIKIVNFQNDSSFDDREMSSDFKKMYQETMALKSKDSFFPSLEKQKNYVIAKTGILMKSINEMSYRSFSQIWKSCVDDSIYIAQKIIQGSFKYKVEQDIKHPQFVKDIDKYEQVFAGTADQFINDFNKING